MDSNMKGFIEFMKKNKKHYEEQQRKKEEEQIRIEEERERRREEQEKWLLREEYFISSRGNLVAVWENDPKLTTVVFGFQFSVDSPFSGPFGLNIKIYDNHKPIRAIPPDIIPITDWEVFNE